jgi:pimeloyl-ACP methyl ester carboxylesterase
MTTLETHELAVPGAVLTYDVRPAESDARPLLMIGSPMSAAGFETLAGHFTDRTVVTYDPRGVDRSRLAPSAGPLTAAVHASDLHDLVDALGIRVDVFASSGGATNALIWAGRHPRDIGTLVAHEPPIQHLLPDRETLRAASDDIAATYQAKGWGHAMARFIALTGHRGPLPADYLERPAPDPAAFGLPVDDDGSRDERLFLALADADEPTPDAAAISAGGTRVVIAHGEESAELFTGRSSMAVADLLGLESVVFPSGHAGFLGGEFGQTGEPERFAVRLREVLGSG